MGRYTTIFNITRKHRIYSECGTFKTERNYEDIHILMHEYGWNKDDCIVYIDSGLVYNIFIYHYESNKMCSIHTCLFDDSLCNFSEPFNSNDYTCTTTY